MEFTIKKYLLNGKYYVQPILTNLDDSDDVKFKKFGEPVIKVKFTDGVERDIELSVLSRINPFGFFLQEDADNYSKILKDRIIEIKNNYNNKTDNWTCEEVV